MKYMVKLRVLGFCEKCSINLSCESIIAHGPPQYLVEVYEKMEAQLDLKVCPKCETKNTILGSKWEKDFC
jgi:hypothetical protein